MKRSFDSSVNSRQKGARTRGVSEEMSRRFIDEIANIYQKTDDCDKELELKYRKKLLETLKADGYLGDYRKYVNSLRRMKSIIARDLKELEDIANLGYKRGWLSKADIKVLQRTQENLIRVYADIQVLEGGSCDTSLFDEI